jgi:seryl-tRNA synthetase
MEQNQNDLDRQDLIAENERLDDKVKALEQSVKALQSCIAEQLEEISAQKQALEDTSSGELIETASLKEQLDQSQQQSMLIWNQHKASSTRRHIPTEEQQQTDG